MKRMTASEARRNWFRLLDEVAAGEVVMIERDGRRVVVRREEGDDAPGTVPGYEGLIEVPDLGRADAWGWEWDEDGVGLRSRASRP